MERESAESVVWDGCPAPGRFRWCCGRNLEGAARTKAAPPAVIILSVLVYGLLLHRNREYQPNLVVIDSKTEIIGRRAFQPSEQHKLSQIRCDIEQDSLMQGLLVHQTYTLDVPRVT